MDVILTLLNETTASGFTKIIQSNITFFHDVLQAPRSEVESQKTRIKELVLYKKKQLSSLDFTLTENRVFLHFLFDSAIKFGLTSVVKIICKIVQNIEQELPLKLTVSLLYLGSYEYVSEIVDNCEVIIEVIDSRKEEVDDEKELVAMLALYFGSVMYNYVNSNSQEVIRLQKKFEDARNLNKYSFLNNYIIDLIINCDVSDSDAEFSRLNDTLDEFLERKKLNFDFSEYLIEDYGEYYDDFKSNPCFTNILQIARNKNPDVYKELGRGVAILDTQEQMFQYLYSFGPMHEAKLLSAFKTMDVNIFDSEDIELIDWGCGQGVASVLFKEYLESKGSIPSYQSVSLIEPSEICLKRAALHVQEIISPCQLLTFNSSLDEFNYPRIRTDENRLKVHLFSNILDVDAFSLETLIDGIKNTFRGRNYFICVSPYVNETKTNRLDVFMQQFNENNFELIKEENIYSGYWNCINKFKGNICADHPVNGCVKKWRKVLRVFSAEL